MNKSTEESYLDRKIRICYDVYSHSFHALDEHTNTKGVVIVTIFTLVYIYISYKIMSIVTLFENRTYTITAITFIISLFLYIFQLLIRKKLLNEDKMLKQYKDMRKNKEVPIHEFVKTKIQSHTIKHTKNGIPYTVMHMANNTDIIVLAFKRGSILDDDLYVKYHYDALDKFYNEVNRKQFKITTFITGESINDDTYFKLTEKIRKAEPKLRELGNDILNYIMDFSEKIGNISIEYVILQSTSERNKVEFASIVQDLETTFNSSSYRAIDILTYEQYLEILQEYFGVSVVADGVISSIMNAVDLGMTKVLGYLKGNKEIEMEGEIFQPTQQSSSVLYNHNNPYPQRTKKGVSRFKKEESESTEQLRNERLFTQTNDVLSNYKNIIEPENYFIIGGQPRRQTNKKEISNKGNTTDTNTQKKQRKSGLRKAK